MLMAADVVPLLLRQQLLSEQQVLDGSLAIMDVSRRNRNFKVEVERGRSYLVKQGIGDEKRRTVAHEAHIYEFLAALPTPGDLAGALPTVFHYDPGESILILDMLPDSRSLRDHLLAQRRVRLGLAQQLGRAIAALHQLTSDADLLHHCRASLPTISPLVFTFHRPSVNVYRQASDAACAVIRIVQSTAGFAEQLRDLGQTWRLEAVIHNDLRLDNWILTSRSAGRRRLTVKLVDWEMAGIGDPAWDVGTVLSEFLNLWLEFAPVSGETPPEQFLDHSPFPLERMRSATAWFWQGYREARSISTGLERELLVRSVRYAGSRLVQTAYERAQYAPELSGPIILTLQLSRNMLERPEEAALHLLGIPPSAFPVSGLDCAS